MNHLAYVAFFLGCFYFITSLVDSSYPAKLSVFVAGDASQSGHSHNVHPVIPGDFADPSIIRVKNTYYATGTSSEWGPHFPLFKSRDLINWEQAGYVLNQTPSWAASSFWAPEIFYHNKQFYVYYVAKKKSDGISCIGVATSTNLENGFTDHGILLEFGKEAIDPFVFKDKDTLYLTWKAYGLDERPIELLASRLSGDGLKVVGTPFTLLKDDQRKGMEGQSLIQKEDYYYLFYSEGGCCGRDCSYNVRVARSQSIHGPFVRYENVLLGDNELWKCPGHGTMVETKDDRYFFMYHAYRRTDHVFTGRQALIDEVIWENGWPRFTKGEERASPGHGSGRMTQMTMHGITDGFRSSRLSTFWQWDFRHSEPEITFSGNNLCLSGVIDEANKTGTVLTVRPSFGDYEITTAVVNRNSSLKGLVIYGDVGEAVGIGTLGDKIQVWQVKKNEKTVLAERQVVEDGKIHLKIAVAGGSRLKFFWRSNGNWKQMHSDAEAASYDGDFLPAWDRSPRPGLIHHGKRSEYACFSFFKIDYGEGD